MMTGRAASRRWPWVLLGAVVFLAVGAASAWAVVTVLRPADDPLAAASHTYVDVAKGEVGSFISLNTVAEWTQLPVGANQAAGIVTAVNVEPGAEVKQGDTLYSVGLRPVVVAQGDVPMFRSISAGVSGDDVTQLQTMLAALGHYGGAIDGKAENATKVAIIRWQKSLGIDPTGVVLPGDVVFVPSLPTRVAVDPEVIHRGATLVGGEDALLGLPVSPRFWVPVTEAQAGMMPNGTAVEVSSPSGGTWLGVTGEQTRDPENGSIAVAVDGVEGAVVCTDACGEIPVSGQTTLPSKIVTVAQVSGLVVPSAALITLADGTTAVIDEKDERVSVEIVASAKGMSVITGVQEGARVRVPASDDAK